MTAWRLVRSELRKLTTTRMPVAFLAILMVIGVINAVAVIWGTDADGSKAFVATAGDQQSLMSFAAKALMIAGFFGAIVAARDYADRTAISTFLAAPRRHRAVLAQLAAVVVGGAVVGFVGSALTIITIALALTTTEFGFAVPAGGVAQLLAASAFAGAAGAVIGAGIGGVVRNTGGAVTGTVLALIVAPPLVVQLADGASAWVPNTLATTASGVDGDVSVAAAFAAMLAWAMVPAIVSLISTARRDVI